MRMRSFANTGEKRMLLRRILIYGGAFFVLAVLQCSFFSYLKPFGATPDIILGGICAAIMLDNKRAAAVCAVCAGYLIDALGAPVLSFSPLFYLICVAVAGWISDKLIPRFASFCVVLLPALALRAAYTYASLWIHTRAFPAAAPMLSIILPELISTFILCLPVYFAIKLCQIPIDAKGHHR